MNSFILNLHQKLLFQNLKRCLRSSANVEFVADTVFYINARLRGWTVRFCGTSFSIKPNRSVLIVFRCGIGDAIYGLPALAELSYVIRKNNNVRLDAVVESKTSVFSNPAVKNLLVASGLFNKVMDCDTYDGSYWKYFDYSGLQSKYLEYQIFPFVYRINTSGKLSRIQEINRQFKISKPISWPKISWPSSDIFFHNATLHKKRLVLIHLETRSGGYSYPYFQGLANLLEENKKRFKDVEWIIFSSCPIENINITIVDPTKLSVAEQIAFVRDSVDAVVAINSYLWPMSAMLDKPLYGIHYLLNDEADQLCSFDTPVLTSSAKVARRLSKAFLAEPKHFFSYGKNSSIINYPPEIIFSFLDRYFE